MLSERVRCDEWNVMRARHEHELKDVTMTGFQSQLVKLGRDTLAPAAGC